MDIFDFLNLSPDYGLSENSENWKIGQKQGLDVVDHFNSEERKTEIWKQARDGTKFFFENEFLPYLKKASEIWCRTCKIEDWDNRNFEDQANAFIHLDKLQFKEPECLRFYPLILNFHQQTPFVSILKPEVLNKYTQVISIWLKSFYFCRFAANCQDVSCKCHLEFYQRAFNRINHNNLNTEKLFSKQNPPFYFKMKLFGKLYLKCIEILRNLDNFLPTYTEIFQKNPKTFFEIVSSPTFSYPIDFTISRVSNVTTVSAQDDPDRLNSVHLQSMYIEAE